MRGRGGCRGRAPRVCALLCTLFCVYVCFVAFARFSAVWGERALTLLAPPQRSAYRDSGNAYSPGSGDGLLVQFSKVLSGDEISYLGWGAQETDFSELCCRLDLSRHGAFVLKRPLYSAGV